MAALNTRAQAARILAGLSAGEGSLSRQLPLYKDREDHGLLQETCYGVCRWWFLLEAILVRLLRRPLKKKEAELNALLLVGLYQLRELALPDYAVINETVAGATQLGRPWAKGLVNGVLRSYQRQAGALEQVLAAETTAIRYSFPNWLVEAIETDWPGVCESLLHYANQRPPMTLRCNLTRQGRESALADLARAGIDAKPGKLAPGAIILETPMPVSALPGFDTGLLSVQDEASQLVPALLEPAPGQRVLDACAAPGGKTCGILEYAPSVSELIALDVDSSRVARIEENLSRLGLTATCLSADAGQPDTWWDGKAFDRILLDAPCSATGVIRRHPDIKILRRAGDLENLARTQLRLLQQLWTTLAPGGRLLYTTCSLLRAENDVVIGYFLEQRNDAKYEGIAADWGVECQYGRQLLTQSQDGPDGFYFALLSKR